MKITVLGCGGSGGVPLIGGHWGSCNPHNPKNRRRRVSVLVEEGDTNILVDFGPDVRVQLLDAQVSKLDAVLATHGHADHTFGIDDLRRLYWVNNNTPVPLYARQVDMDELQYRFDYAFKPFLYGAAPLPPFDCHILDVKPFRIGDITITPFVQDHGPVTSLGFRFNDFAYSTDIRAMSEENFATLAGIKVWVVDAIREEPGHKAHSYLAQTLEWIGRVKPQQAYLTHMDIHMDYDAILAKCPPGVEPAYDGLEIIL